MASLEEERARRIEELVRRVEQIPDRESRGVAHELMEAVLEMHGAGLDRAMEIVFESPEGGEAAIRRLAGDPLVSSLLLLHGLHPDDLETRAQRAVSKLQIHAELRGVFEGEVRVRVPAGASGVGSVEATLREALPDAARIIVEEGGPSNGFVPLANLGAPVSRLG
jgi:hypothetical protein